MPVRRAFNPQPMNEPHTGPHGSARSLPLTPAPQPLPPLPQPQQPSQPGQPGQPAPPQSMGAQLPPSIPMQPPTPPQPPPRPPQAANATVTPGNVQPFLSAEQGTASQPPSDLGANSPALLKLLAGLGHTGEPLDDESNDAGY